MSIVNDPGGFLCSPAALHTEGVIVDRDSALPLWAQVLADLRRRLASGEFGQRVPGDDELTAQYGVSRHTVREAVRGCRSRASSSAAGGGARSSGTR